MDKRLEKKGIVNIKGVTIPCVVMEDGTRVLGKEGVEQLVETLFESSPGKVLERSVLVKLDDFEGYVIDVIMDIYKNVKEKNNEVTGHLLEVGLAALVDKATDNDNPNSRGYQEYMDRSEKMTERQFSDFDRIMKKALEFNPDKKKKNPKA